MQTRLFRIDPANIDRTAVAAAAAILRSGDVVAFPTETVYGLGANGLSPQAVSKIFAAKGRPSDNPLILHIAHLDELDQIVAQIPPVAKRLIERFWPGPLTLVLPKNARVPEIVTAGLSTVAVRMPSHPVARAIIAASKLPIAAPSANISGRPSPTRSEHVWEDLFGKIAAVVDGGAAGIGLESTVVDLSTQQPYLLRPGGVTLEELEEVVGRVQVGAEAAKTETPKSPGMKYRHYAPKAPVWVVEAKHPTEIGARLTELAKDTLNRGEIPALLISKETSFLLEPFQKAIIKVLGSRDDPSEVAGNLFAALREADSEGASVIYAEGIGEAGMGSAVMNRLWKAAGGRRI